jgi:hypothetical protein
VESAGDARHVYSTVSVRVNMRISYEAHSGRVIVETVAAAGGQNRPRGGCSGVGGGGQSGRLPTSHWDRPRWGRRGRAQFLLLLYIYIFF